MRIRALGNSLLVISLVQFIATTGMTTGCDSSTSQDPDSDGGMETKGTRLWEEDKLANGERIGLSVSKGNDIAIAFVSYIDEAYWVALATEGVSGFEVSQVAQLPDTTLIDPGPIAIVHDDTGQIHLAWGQGDVAYATRDGEAWVVESVAGNAGHPALALQPDGPPQLAFFEEGNFMLNLYHAVRTDSGWVQSTVGKTREGVRKSRVDLVVSGSDDPWIVAIDGTEDSVLFWRRDGTAGWVSETVFESTTPVPSLYGLTAIALDAAGAPMVAFVADSGLYLAQRPALGEWVVEPVDVRNMTWDWSIDGWLELALGADGTVFIAAAADAQFGSAAKADGIMLFERAAGSAWTFQQLLTRACDSELFALDTDSATSPLFAHACGEPGLLTPTGVYPSDWQEQCGEVVAILCDAACGCENSSEDCQWTIGTSESGCPLNMSNTICHPTVTPSMLAACAAVASTSVCKADADGDEALRFSSACAAIPPPIGY